MAISDLVYIDDTGFHYADYPAFQTFVANQFRTIYGADIYIEPDSQDGQLIAVYALALYQSAIVNAATFNSYSPATSQGLSLSRNVKINGLRRRTPTYSTVDLTIGGTVGTTITNGVARDILDQRWNLPTTVVIPSGGSIIVTATAQQLGAVQALPSTVNSIFTPTQGWQTVNNVNAATPGAPVETDAELRTRQSISTANPSLTVLDGTIGAVGNLTGVLRVRGYENDTGVTDANGLPPHSICIVVVGGVTLSIAQAIQIHKTPGTETFGTTTQEVFDSRGMPLLIKFTRATLVPITVEITIEANANYSNAVESEIKALVAQAINAFGIGQQVLITKLYAPAYLNVDFGATTYDVVTLLLSRDGNPLAATNIPIDYDEVADCNPLTNITIVVT